MQEKIPVIAIAATGRNRELGKSNELIWTIPEDLKRFRERTEGHPVIMGRKTFESILGYRNNQPLPNRTSIVLTSNPDFAFEHPDVIVVSTIEEALERANSFPTDAIYVAGGAQIYKEALPYTNVIDQTEIDAEASDADTFFPSFDEFANVTAGEWQESGGLRYRYVTRSRATPPSSPVSTSSPSSTQPA